MLFPSQLNFNYFGGKMRFALLLMALSFNVLAQDYHDEDLTPKCQREACIVNDDAGYGFYIVEDQDGNKAFKLNTDASLLDLPFKDMCFTGNVKEAVQIVQALAGKANQHYYQGGHFKVERITSKSITNSLINLDVTVFSDYDLNTFDDELIVKRCTN